MTREDRIVAELAKAVGGLELVAIRAARTAQHSDRNRLSLLHLHAAAACYIGPLFAMIGPRNIAGPIWVLLRQVPGMPYSVGLWLMTGGIVLAIGLSRRNDRVQAIGLGMMLAWYATLAASFCLAIPIWLLDGQPQPQPAWYAHGVYAHLTGILAVHMHTLRQRHRDKRRGRRR